ncbi:MAG: hypothetical protein HC822_12280 [Oscillochloris sp.]|nr:hypothetical protein [Oscillochloris sp.]
MATREYRNRFDGWDLLLQILSGFAGGLTLAVVGTVVGSWLSPAGADPALGGVIGLVAGYPLGVGLGIWLAGRRERPASFALAALGAYLGAGVVLLGLALGLSGELPYLWALIAVFSLAGGLVGHALAARR